MAYTRIFTYSPNLQTLQGLSVLGGTSPTFSTTKAFTNTHTLRFTSSNYCVGYAFTGTSKITANCWINHAGVATNGKAALCAWQEGADLYAMYWDQAAATLKLDKGATNLASTAIGPTGLTATDTWLSVGVNVYANSSGYATMYVSGTNVFTYSGDLGSSITEFYSPGRYSATTAWSSYLYMDDFYIDDSVGESDVVPTVKRFQYSEPDGNGSTNDMTVVGAASNYQAVDEVGVNDDTDYIYADQSGDRDLFTTANVTSPANYGIKWAIPMIYVKRTNASVTSQIKFVTHDGTNTEVSTAQTPSTTYDILFHRFDNQPDSTEWNDTDFNAMEFGVESAGTF